MSSQQESKRCKKISNMSELNNSRPVIEIELIWLGAGQSNKGVSSKNSQASPTFIGDAIWHFELHWDFQLIIRNNSSFPAYDIELLFKEGKFDYIDKINPKIPILHIPKRYY